jgi:pSer/pThr/pTyr-binding forkhead associated (FHA) protein
MAGPVDLLLRNTDRVFSLQPEQTLTVGRTSPCDLRIDDPSVSRRHCRITLLVNGLLQVRDLESGDGARTLDGSRTSRIAAPRRIESPTRAAASLIGRSLMKVCWRPARGCTDPGSRSAARWWPT